MGMKYNLINMIYFFIIFELIGNRYPVIAHLYDIDTLRQFATDSYDTMKNVYDTHSESSTPPTADIMDKMKDIIASIDKWDTGFKERVEAINTWVLGLSSVEGGIEQNMHNLIEHIGWIEELYGEFRKYVETPDSLSEATAGELSELYTSVNEEDLIGSIHDMFSIISPDRWGNYKNSLWFSIAWKTQSAVPKSCGVSSHQQLLQFYSVIVITEMKALTMTDFGYLIKGFKENVSYIGNMEMTAKECIARVEKYLLILRKAVDVVPRQFQLCDPPGGYIRGESFYEFERFMQMVVLNEMIISPETCSETCNNLPEPTKIYQCDGIGCHNSVPICQGKVKFCTSLHDQAGFCEYPDDAPRRYQWIRDGWGSYYPSGTTRECNMKYHYPQSHYDFIYNCDICRCICVEDSVWSPSHHFISLREQLSDVAQNMVIVGLKFRVVNQILHIDILQGPIGCNGTIDKDKVEWKDGEDIQYDKDSSTKSGSFKFHKIDGNGNREAMIVDKDIAVLTWKSRRIYLDTLTSPAHHLITGIRFARDLNGASRPIHLEIQATPFNYKLGKLDFEESRWIGPDDTYYAERGEPRMELKPKRAIYSPEKSEKTALDKTNKFIDLIWSGWTEDASQTVTPFLDARAVYVDPLVGLTGVGLYHKKQDGAHGGFLSFVLEEFDSYAMMKNCRKIY